MYVGACNVGAFPFAVGRDAPTKFERALHLQLDIAVLSFYHFPPPKKKRRGGTHRFKGFDVFQNSQGLRTSSFAFFTWGPLVPTVLLSAIGLSMDMFIF